MAENKTFLDQNDQQNGIPLDKEEAKFFDLVAQSNKN